MIWPNELALLMLSIMDSPSDETKAIVALIALTVWFFVVAAPVVTLFCLIMRWLEK